ncbi:MAG: hypothetical protein M3Y65_19550, partial [Pseudomonadota bacterium]|nr:hypothetical protein [Pseudomonadota bacterium]
ELESTLRNYLKIYNNSIPQRALEHQTPIQALKNWHDKKPELFFKRVYNQAGLDIYPVHFAPSRPERHPWSDANIKQRCHPHAAL